MLTFHSIAQTKQNIFVWKNQLQNKAFNYNTSYLIYHISHYPSLSLNFFLCINQFREVETIKKKITQYKIDK